jgi:hypothetical protein
MHQINSHLPQCGNLGKIFDRPHQPETRADIADGGGHGAMAVIKSTPVPASSTVTGQKSHVERQKSEYASHDIFRHRFAADLDVVTARGWIMAKKFFVAVLEAEHDAQALHAAAGGSGRRAHKHAQKDDGL